MLRPTPGEQETPVPLAPEAPSPAFRWLRPVAALVVAIGFLAGPTVPPATAADPITMTAKVLLQGHARVGSWMAIQIELSNSGPAVKGELRLAGGASGRTRFSVPVDLPTTARQAYLLHAQPPSFGRSVKVELVAGDRTIASADAGFLAHDASQLVVGIVAEKPDGIIRELHLAASASGLAPAIVSLGVADLPDRLEAWGTLDRLIWQDVDSTALTPQQLTALRGWVAGGGRLVIVGGTAGIATLAGFPDDLLPYRPTATVDVAPASITTLVGIAPAGSADIPAFAGTLGGGQALATAGDRVIAAGIDHGSGSVTVIGFDPTTAWLASSHDIDSLWRRFLPPRAAGGPVVSTDDSQIVSAVSQLASLALPPIGGLIALLAGYILLIGPLNYLILKRFDRRELAWLTMPALIVVFAVVAYGFGTALRGTDVIVNEVAVVRGAPGATEGAAQVYVGVYSPTRTTYQLQFPGSALLAAPLSGSFAGTGDPTVLDLVQADPALVRDLAVGFSSQRTVRADSPATVPLVKADLAFTDGSIKGTITNASNVTLERVALVLGGSVDVLGDMPAGASRPVSLLPIGNPFLQPLSDQIFGQLFGDTASLSDDALRQRVRHAVVDQLTFNPQFGSAGPLVANGPVILAWGRSAVLDVSVSGRDVRRSANVLYYLPLGLKISGQTTFTSDLISSTIVASDAAFFSKDPSSLNMGAGSATIAYRPIAFSGTIAPSGLQFSLNGAGVPSAGAIPLEPDSRPPVPCVDANNTTPAGCVPRRLDGIPDVDVFDIKAGAWVHLPHPAPGIAYSITDPARYVDPTTGEALFRFVNDSADQGVGFQFQVAISGLIS
jgi:hypothetical protein